MSGGLFNQLIQFYSLISAETIDTMTFIRVTSFLLIIDDKCFMFDDLALVLLLLVIMPIATTLTLVLFRLSLMLLVQCHN
jgi:hypothetical protein